MKRKSTAYRFVQAFLIVCLVFLLSVTVWAQETTLTTVVPSSHTLYIELTGEATIIVDGVAYTESTEIQVQRQSRPEISLKIADGYKAKTVLWGSNDITEAIQSGKWIAPEITKDFILTITLEKTSSTPQTGDSFYPEQLFTLLMLPVLGLTVCLLRRKKKIA